MKKNKINLMKARVSFYEKASSGPEVGGSLKEVYECACDYYEPTMRDVEVLDVTSSKSKVTLTIRNALPEFRPQTHHQFKLKNGFFKDENFHIQSVGPYSDNPNFIKIVGEGI